MRFGSITPWGRMIGSAYGGTVIACAQAELDAVGIEVERALIPLARANQQDHPGVKARFLHGSIADSGFVAQLGQFDVITCENVIEHVDDAQSLIMTIRRLLHPGGIVHMSIPNPFCYSEVQRDGHYSIFGLTLLDMPTAIAYYQAVGNTEPYSVGEYCFTYSEYLAKFARAGLTPVLLNPVAYSDEAVQQLKADMETLPAELDAFAHKEARAGAFQKVVQQKLDTYLATFQQRYQAYSDADGVTRLTLGDALMRDYRQSLWMFVISDAAPVPLNQTERTAESAPA
jgi:SAM-dependent methyltransferase